MRGFKFLFCFLLVAFLMPMNLVEADTVNAKLQNVKGEVFVQKMGAKKEITAFNDMRVSQGDVLRTGNKSSVKIVFGNGNEATMSANAKATLARLAENQTAVKQESGGLWHSVKSFFGFGEKYEVETSTSVMGVRGTLFYTMHDANSDGAQVRVLDGSVAVKRNQSRESQPEKIVEVNQELKVEKDTTVKAEPKSLEIKKFVEQLDANLFTVVMDDVIETTVETEKKAKEQIEKIKETQDKEQAKVALATANNALLLANLTKEIVNEVARSPRRQEFEEALRESEQTLQEIEKKATEIKETSEIARKEVIETAKESGVVSEEEIKELNEEVDKQIQESEQNQQKATDTKTDTTPTYSTTPPTLSNVTNTQVTVGENVTASSNRDGYVYLVPVNTTKSVAELNSAANGTNGIKVAVTAGQEVNLSTTGFALGIYVVYAVDHYNNISAASSTIEVMEPILHTIGSKLVILDEEMTKLGEFEQLPETISNLVLEIDQLIAQAIEQGVLEEEITSLPSYDIYIDTTPPTLSNVTNTQVTVGENVTASSNRDGYVYLVPVNTTKSVAELNSAANGTIGIKVAVTTGQEASLNTTGFEPGSYVVYAVDHYNNISAASNTIEVMEPILHTIGSKLVMLDEELAQLGEFEQLPETVSSLVVEIDQLIAQAIEQGVLEEEITSLPSYDIYAETKIIEEIYKYEIAVFDEFENAILLENLSMDEVVTSRFLNLMAGEQRDPSVEITYEALNFGVDGQTQSPSQFLSGVDGEVVVIGINDGVEDIRESLRVTFTKGSYEIFFDLDYLLLSDAQATPPPTIGENDFVFTIDGLNASNLSPKVTISYPVDTGVNSYQYSSEETVSTGVGQTATGTQLGVNLEQYSTYDYVYITIEIDQSVFWQLVYREQFIAGTRTISTNDLTPYQVTVPNQTETNPIVDHVVLQYLDGNLIPVSLVQSDLNSYIQPGIYNVQVNGWDDTHGYNLLKTEIDIVAESNHISFTGDEIAEVTTYTGNEPNYTITINGVEPFYQVGNYDTFAGFPEDLNLDKFYLMKNYYSNIAFYYSINSIGNNQVWSMTYQVPELDLQDPSSGIVNLNDSPSIRTNLTPDRINYLDPFKYLDAQILDSDDNHLLEILDETNAAAVKGNIKFVSVDDPTIEINKEVDLSNFGGLTIGEINQDLWGAYEVTFEVIGGPLNIAPVTFDVFVSGV